MIENLNYLVARYDVSALAGAVQYREDSGMLFTELGIRPVFGRSNQEIDSRVDRYKKWMEEQKEAQVPGKAVVVPDHSIILSMFVAGNTENVASSIVAAEIFPPYDDQDVQIAKEQELHKYMEIGNSATSKTDMLQNIAALAISR